MRVLRALPTKTSFFYSTFVPLTLWRIHSLPLNQNKNTHKMWVFLFWWESACTNRAENKQEFTDLMQQVKEFNEKWLISPDGEN
jgi:hypothetical protein